MSAANVKILPSGKSVTLRSPDDVSERLRRPISRAIRIVRPEIMASTQAAREAIEKAKDGTEEEQAAAREQAAAAAREMTDDEIDAFSAANDHAVVALVERWDFPEPITLEAVVERKHRDYDALRELVAPLVGQLFLDASPSPDPQSPTAPSAGSSSASVEGLSTTLRSTGVPIA